jgi:zinc transporter 5/7
MIFLTPDTIGMQFNASQTSQTFLVSYPIAFLVATAMGFLGFSQHPHWIDLLVGMMMYRCQFSFRMVMWLASYLLFSSVIP